MAHTHKSTTKKKKDQLKAGGINPLLKGILKKTPKGEDPKKGGRPYTPPGKTKMDGTPLAKRKRKKRSA